MAFFDAFSRVNKIVETIRASLQAFDELKKQKEELKQELNRTETFLKVIKEQSGDIVLEYAVDCNQIDYWIEYGPDWRGYFELRSAVIISKIQSIERRIQRWVRHLDKIKIQIRQLFHINWGSLIRKMQRYLFKNMDDTHKVLGQLLVFSYLNVNVLNEMPYGADYSVYHKKIRVY